MAVKTKEEILNQLKALAGDRSDDAMLAFIEDVSDTFSSYETRGGYTEDQMKAAMAEWETKYNENDAAWRQRYRDRFFSSVDAEVEEKIEEIETKDDEDLTFDALFKKERG